MADNRTWKYEPEENNMLANIGEYIDGRMIRFVCEFAEPPTAEDAALMIAAKNATATPPADAAHASGCPHATKDYDHPCACGVEPADAALADDPSVAAKLYVSLKKRDDDGA